MTLAEELIRFIRVGGEPDLKYFYMDSPPFLELVRVADILLDLELHLLYHQAVQKMTEVYPNLFDAYNRQAFYIQEPEPYNQWEQEFLSRTLDDERVQRYLRRKFLMT